MMQVLPLEDFGTSGSISSTEEFWSGEAAGDETNDGAKTEAYEQGYKAGWDDAVQAESENHERISAEFARNLQDLGFTFHEAKTHVLKALDQFLSQIVGTLLPDVVAQTMGQRIIEELMPMARDAADVPIQVIVHPATRPALEPLLSGTSALQLEIIDEPSLGMGQVSLKAANSEKIIDMQAVLQGISTGLETMRSINNKEAKHG